jgi:hypothetical protein
MFELATNSESHSSSLAVRPHNLWIVCFLRVNTWSRHRIRARPTPTLLRWRQPLWRRS